LTVEVAPVTVGDPSSRGLRKRQMMILVHMREMLQMWEL